MAIECIDKAGKTKKDLPARNQDYFNLLVIFRLELQDIYTQEHSFSDKNPI